MITLKTEKELELMREPCRIVRDVLLLIESKIRPGMTTRELDKIAYDYITACGAKPSFLVVHGFPSDRVIKENEIVSVDVGA